MMGKKNALAMQSPTSYDTLHYVCAQTMQNRVLWSRCRNIASTWPQKEDTADVSVDNLLVIIPAKSLLHIEMLSVSCHRPLGRMGVICIMLVLVELAAGPNKHVPWFRVNQHGTKLISISFCAFAWKLVVCFGLFFSSICKEQNCFTDTIRIDFTACSKPKRDGTQQRNPIFCRFSQSILVYNIWKELLYLLKDEFP
uniref:Uncharacterized protein n=1 Tax=Glossina pallidipes TaxID=7398 RepID=A0A1A9ZJ71_GLOPL